MAETIKFNSGSTSPLWNRRVGLAGSAASGALSASFAPNETWGTAGAGTLGITVGTRSNLQCTPDTVLFEPDLSAATFDTPAQWVHPGGADGPNPGTAGDLAHPGYDARLHDILFFWDFGYDRTYSKTQNVLTHWQNARYATGPKVSHCFTVADTHTVTLTAFEPSSGKMATATVSVPVGTPDSVYSSGETVYVNPDGDTDFSQAPGGSTQWSLSQFIANNEGVSSAFKRRYLFKAGEEYLTGEIDLWRGAKDVYYGAYGVGARPKLAAAYKQWDVGGHDASDGGPTDIRIVGFDCDGEWDRVNETWGVDNEVINSSDDTGGKKNRVEAGLTDSDGINSRGVGNDFLSVGDAHGTLVISDCQIRRYFQKVANFQVAADNHRLFRVHFDDNEITDFGGHSYVILSGQHLDPDTAFSFTGNYYNSGPEMPGNFDGSEALIRLETWERVFISKNDMFTAAGTNAFMKIENTPTDFSGFDLTNSTTAEATGPWIHGRTWVINENYFEGNNGLTNCRTMKQGGGAQNGILERNLYSATHNTDHFFETGGQGITIRWNMVQVPDMARYLTSSFNHYVKVGRFTYEQELEQYWFDLTLDSGETNDGVGNFWVWETRPFAGMAPVKIYDNTLVCRRSFTNNGSSVPVESIIEDEDNDGAPTGYGAPEAVYFRNNVLHCTDAAYSVSVAGLDSTTLLPDMTPYYEGLTTWDSSFSGTEPRYVLRTPGNSRDISSQTIPTFAGGATTPDGTVEANVTLAKKMPLDVAWFDAASPDAALIDTTSSPIGAWSEDATPT